jgi:alkaline phosphatase D
VLDTRQFRSNQPCGGALDLAPPPGDDFALACGGELDSTATLTGEPQEAWLQRRLDGSAARWNVIAQQIMMASVDFNPAAPLALRNLDAWDGYAAARERLLGFVRDHRVRNPIALAGDIHSSWVSDLRPDFSAPGATVATEFVGTSISSSFPPEFIPLVQAALPANPHVKFFDGAFRGYARCDVDRRRWRTEFLAVSSVATPEATLQQLAAFEVEDGVPGATRV